MKQRLLQVCLPFLVLYSLLSVFITFTSGSLVAVASQTLPPGVVIGDEAGISASSEGEYYVDLPNVLPGESYEKTITIRGMDVKEPFELGILVTPESTKGVINFDKLITLTLFIDGKELYKGPLLGNGEFDWTVQPLIVGICEYGKDQILTAVFEINKDLTLEDYKEESQLLYHWTFVATKNQPKPSEETVASSTPDNPKPKGTFPMTGEEIKNLIYKTLAGLLLVLIAILLWKKRKDDQRNVD
ncbi:LPXTG cell wall anchor domain-containing protein [Candidatus Enterococcus ikei]|uniref:LPXTG cell wall anchor domain-containing protein n=1 Tax=Candidatus Enterococcus ikei TaxID=2815326 RepID=A0ABS3GXI1_9ENTE|nr:LPXTG cell wall anchor domain-containing protein [Enterococcus sp. DIV0869a]MBO0439915.1 LPXTG cell wall anchor domain-containing protein [Enterococcus sp. DIV0869a]